MKPPPRQRKAFTLMESMMATVVLATVAAGIALPLSSGGSIQAAAIRKTMATKLANDMMAEIAATDFDTIVGSYDGLSEPAGGLRDYNGDTITGTVYDGFSRRVTCSSASVGKVGTIWVTVSVSYNGTELVELKRLFGP